jgi:transposase
MTQHHDGAPVGVQCGTILVVFELSKAKWLLGVQLPGATRLSRYVVGGGDVAAVAQLIEKARSRAGAGSERPVRVVSAYEAGYD